MFVPDTTKELYDEIKLRNLEKVTLFLQKNLSLFRPMSWVRTLDLMKQANIITAWNTINVPLDTPPEIADKLYGLDKQLLHPELMRTIKED